MFQNTPRTPIETATQEIGTLTQEMILKGHHSDVSISTIWKVHPANNGRIVISIPGENGDIDGFNDKYTTLANFVRKEVGAVIRCDNKRDDEKADYALILRERAREMVRYALSHSSKICGAKVPEIYLMGVSAGAGAIAAVAKEFAEVKRVLLIAPGKLAGIDAIVDGLRAFQGMLYIALPAEDTVIPKEVTEQILQAAGESNAELLKVFTIPGCDHQFKGEVNGKYLSSLPRWAFTDTIPEPNPSKGVFLY